MISSSLWYNILILECSVVTNIDFISLLSKDSVLITMLCGFILLKMIKYFKGSPVTRDRISPANDNAIKAKAAFLALI